ncbi:MAG: ATP-dependent metallopeptidase FtsH/Yme1/Tma family protein, partial [Clostridia bacterium]|nr:ATP-dependent metallopeptidase FtsH/Yme1/Tma family protein [Clostridia bacterium]
MKSFFRGISFYILIFIIILSIVYMYGKPPETVEKLDYSKFVIELRNENIESIHITESTITGQLKKTGSDFETYVPSNIEPEVVFEKYILPQVEEGKIDLSGQPPAKTPWF